MSDEQNNEFIGVTSDELHKEGNYIKMTLDDKWFDLFKSENKNWEIRVYDEKRRKISLFDTIEFENKLTGEFVHRKVVGLIYFESLKDAYYSFSDYDLIGMFPGICHHIDHWLNIYGSIPGYIEKSDKYGVLAIKLK